MYYYVEQFRRKDSVVAMAAEEVLTTKMLRCSAAGSDGINQPNQSTTVIDGAVKEESESSRLKGRYRVIVLHLSYIGRWEITLSGMS
jgi:hypothetical protein